MKVLYDGECGFCSFCLALLLRLDWRRRLRPITIQEAEGQRLLGPVPESERLLRAHVVTSDGTVLSGAEAMPAICRQLPRGRRLAALLASTMPLTRLLYGLLTSVRSMLGSMLPPCWGRWALNVIADRRRGTTPPTTVA